MVLDIIKGYAAIQSGRGCQSQPIAQGVNVAMTTGKATPLGTALRRYRGAFVTVITLSAIMNVLLLGGSIYMMLVYDSVLPSHSVPTLMGLLIMVAAVYAFQGLFENLRTRILNTIAARLDQDVSPRLQRAIFDVKQKGAKLPGDGLSLMRDFDQIRGFLSGPGPGALIDLPWIGFFLIVLGLLHYWLGLTAFIGAALLIGLTLFADQETRRAVEHSGQVAAYRNGIAGTALQHSELLSALGMRKQMLGRWEEVNAVYRTTQLQLSKTAGLYSGISRVSRMFLQSVILSVGALLVIDGKASGGVIFASSILAGRALAPVDAAIANWRSFAAAQLGWKRVNDLLLKAAPDFHGNTTLLPPSCELLVENLTVAPPGTQRITVNDISFRLRAGEALGIIGPSAAGKTSLGRALIGVWRPERGAVRLDGATLDQWAADSLGGYFGYLPQAVELLEGTVAENIARFEDDYASEDVIAAAQMAGVHDLIVHLPRGYEMPVGADGVELSAGQRQRIGLARALYKNPFLVLLDEPNSNLDAAGEAALAMAVEKVRARGGIVVMIAHRAPALAQVSHVLLMHNGNAQAFGLRDEVLAQIAKPTPIRPANAGKGLKTPDAAEQPAGRRI